MEENIGEDLSGVFTKQVRDGSYASVLSQYWIGSLMLTSALPLGKQILVHQNRDAQIGVSIALCH